MREKNVRQLCGRDIEIVKDGLDENQVQALVDELVAERESLGQRQEHLLSLTKLAEKTVAEADKLAGDINQEAAAKATKILAKAEQDAQKLVEQKQAEGRAVAEREAQAIKAAARQQAERLVSEYHQQVQEAIKKGASKLHTQLLSGLKDVVEQAIAMQGDWEKRLSELVIESPSAENWEVLPPVSPEQVETSPVAGVDSEYQCDILEQLQQAWGPAEAAPEQPAVAPRVVRQLEVETVELEVPSTAEPPKTYEGKVELEIMPPLAPSQLVEIQSYLRDWPGIGIAELRPKNKGYSITLILDKPIQLIDILRQLPEVKEAAECKAEVLVGDAPSRDCPRRIAVTVSGRK
jgi:vacuolar-type H+-ATPase subunit H